MKMKSITYVALAMLIIALACAAAFAEWPMFRQDPARAGFSDNAMSAEKPNPIWVFPYPETHFGEPIDNGDPGFSTSGGWTALTGDAALNAYDSTAVATPVSAAGGAWAEWTYTFKTDDAPHPASFYIYVWFPSVVNSAPHSRDAEYTITINGAVVGRYRVDQTSGGAWVSLGGRPFTVRVGTTFDTLTIRLTNQTDIDARDVEAGTVVVADAVKLDVDNGVVLASPAASRSHDIVVTPRIESRPLQNAKTQSGTRSVGVVYGVGTEPDSGISGPQTDDRGFKAWQYPTNPENWIAGGFSSSPAITNYGGEEVAVVGGADGTVYAIRTGPGVSDDNRLAWRGPGYFVDNPDTANGWVAGTHSGYQGGNYLQTKAVKRGGNVDPVVWKQAVSKKGKYAIFAWIPPSTSGEVFAADAQYEVKAGAGEPDKVFVDQRNGGRWVTLGSTYDIDAGTTVTVSLDNSATIEVNDASEQIYVAADMIKIAPAELGPFEFSSPVVDGSTVYIGSTSGRVYALTLGDPDPLWVYPEVGDNQIGPVYASPALDGGTLYVGSKDGRVYAIKAGNGRLDWVCPGEPAQGEVQQSLGEISSTTASGRYVYACIGGYAPIGPGGINQKPTSGKVIAINKSSGAIEKMYPDATQNGKGAFLYSSPLLMDMPDGTPLLAVGSTDGYFYAMNANTMEGFTETGKWDSATDDDAAMAYPDLRDAAYSSPAGTVLDTSNIPMAYIGTEGSRILGIDLRAGDIKWKQALHGRVTSSPALNDNRLYVGDGGGLTWAFSTRAGSGPGGMEGWNDEVGKMEDVINTDEDGQADPRVDVFSREFYDLLTPDAVVDMSTKKLRDEALTDKLATSTTMNYEWGQTLYIVAWGLVPPKDNPTTDWTDPNFNRRSESTVTTIIKSRAPGEQGDSSQSFTMSTKGCIRAKDDDGDVKLLYFAKYAYVLDSSSPSKPQSPGSTITIAVQERPGGKSNGYSPGDSVVPDHKKAKFGVTDSKTGLMAARYTPQIFAINNPLALAYEPPATDYLRTGAMVGVRSGGGTDKTIAMAAINGNDLLGSLPWVGGGIVSHGTSSSEQIFAVGDRSLLRAIGQKIDKFRAQRHDLHWRGGPNQAVNPLPWDVLPAGNDWNNSLDYPDIRARQYTCLMADTRRDPTQDAVDLKPSIIPTGASIDDPGVTWEASFNPLAVQYTIPRFQPANVPQSSTTMQAEWQKVGYSGRSYVFVDSNRDGRLNRPAELGQTALLTQRVSGARAEAYREFNAQVHVPTDYRIEVVEKTIDLGKVPHGFGWTVDANNPGHPFLFYPSLNDCFHPWNYPGKPGYREWFKPFTAYNLGNVNIMNIRLAKYIQPSGANGVTPLFLASDTVETTGLIPAACVVSTIDPFFQSNGQNPWPVSPLMGLNQLTRSFHKARVGEDAPVLRVPDIPERMFMAPGSWSLAPYNASNPPPLPALSVAVPLGTPVGTYSQKLTLFHNDPKDEVGGWDGVFQAGESLGNPPMEVKVTVTESRLTDGLIEGVLPQVDTPATTAGTGDMTPAAYTDPKTGSMHMIWASSRYGPDIQNTTTMSPTDPWYLYMSTLPCLRFTNGWTWGFANPASYQWWSPTAPTSAFPTVGMLPNLFPTSGGATLLKNSVKFYSPSVAIDRRDGRAWLFFGGQAYIKQTTSASVESKKPQYRVFYTELEGGQPDNSVPATTQDLTMPKYGIRGLATRIKNDLWLWAFWHGGNNDKSRIYFNVNRNPDAANGPDQWTNDAQLVLPMGITAASDAIPMYRPESSAGKDKIDLIYTGYSSFRKNNDIYLSRYDPGGSTSSGSIEMDMEALPEIPDEELAREASTSVWSSRHVDWVKNDSDRPIIVSVKDPKGVVRRVNVGDVVIDSQTGAYIYGYPDYAKSSSHAVLREMYRSVVVNPEAGTVKFLRLPADGSVVYATYSPKAYRLTTDAVSDVSPFAIYDIDPNPRYVINSNDPQPFIVSTSWDNSYAPPMDRLWLFWRRPTATGNGTGVYYKAFRYIVRLNQQVAVDDNGFAAVESVTVIRAPGNRPRRMEGLVETDWVKNRLYFSAADEGKRVLVTYTPKGADSQIQEQYTVRLEEEPDVRGNAFGNLTNQMVNEGQMCAFKDTTKSNMDPTLWVFWTSTRSGNTDIYYETISPRFYGIPLR